MSVAGQAGLSLKDSGQQERDTLQTGKLPSGRERDHLDSVLSLTEKYMSVNLF